MNPLDDSDHPESLVDPASIRINPTAGIAIDISSLLRAQASEPARLEASSLESMDELAGIATIAPLIGLVSRSVDFALGFLELPHFRILVLLSQRNSISAAELVNAMKMPARKMLALLDSMDSAGWIFTAVPGRGVAEEVAISEQGRALVDDVTTKRQRDIDEILGRLSEDDRFAIAKAFDSFATAAREPAIRKRKSGIAP